MNRVHPRKCWRENEKGGKCSIPRFLFVLLASRANINLSIREEEEGCARIWFSRCQCRALILGTRDPNTKTSRLSLFRDEKFQSRDRCSPILRNTFLWLSRISFPDVTRHERKREKVQVLLSGEEFEEADWLQSRKWISANQQFHFSFFFFFTLDRPRSENLSFEMINRNLLGDARRRKFPSSLFPRVVAPSKVRSGLDEDSAGLSLIDLWGGGWLIFLAMCRMFSDLGRY